MNDFNYVCISGNVRSWHINSRRATIILSAQDVDGQTCHPEILAFEKEREKLQKMFQNGDIGKGDLVEVFGSVLPCTAGRTNQSQSTAIVAHDIVTGPNRCGMEGENEFIFHGEIKSIHQLTTKLSIATIRMECDGRVASVAVVMDRTKGIKTPAVGYAQLSGHVLTRNILLPISKGICPDYTLERLHDYICTEIKTF